MNDTQMFLPHDLLICTDDAYAALAQSLHGLDTRTLEPLESPDMQALRDAMVAEGRFMGDKPITATHIGQHVLVVDGNRRVRLRRAYWPDEPIPCVLIDSGDIVGASLRRNVYRKSSTLERAHEVKRMLDAGHTEEAICNLCVDESGSRMTVASLRKLLRVATNLIDTAKQSIRRYDSGDRGITAFPFWTLEPLAAQHPVAQQEVLDRMIRKRRDGESIDAKQGASIASGVECVARPPAKLLRQMSQDATLERELPEVALVLRWVSGALEPKDLAKLKKHLGTAFPQEAMAKQTKLG